MDVEKRWSLQQTKCKSCGTTTIKHRARGLCVNCYNSFCHSRSKGQRGFRGKASQIITREFLIDKYRFQGMSMIDIAKECGCTRQYIDKKFKEYKIRARTKASARKRAIDAGKIKFERTNEHGETKIVTMHRQFVRKGFFLNWSPEMAYVLGVIYTDGCLVPGKNRDPHTRNNSTTSAISIAQKEPEILEKVLILMECNAKLYHRARKSYKSTTSGDIFFFTLYKDDIYDDLIKIGLKPNKSRDIEFPYIPAEYLRHFIRGCWDGDGSVYYDKMSLSASFTSGSKSFAEGMLKALHESGLPERTLHTLNRKSFSYYFRFTGSQCINLYHYMYDEVPEGQYLKRKYEIFRNYAENNPII